MGIDGSQSARTDLKIRRHILQRRRMVPWYAVCGPLTCRKLVTGGRDDTRGSRCHQLQNQELRLQSLSLQLLMALGTRLIPVENLQRQQDFSL